MKTPKMTVRSPKPRNRLAVAARLRKAGPHQNRPGRSAEKQTWRQEWLDNKTERKDPANPEAGD